MNLVNSYKQQCLTELSELSPEQGTVSQVSEMSLFGVVRARNERRRVGDLDWGSSSAGGIGWVTGASASITALSTAGWSTLLVLEEESEESAEAEELKAGKGVLSGSGGTADVAGSWPTGGTSWAMDTCGSEICLWNLSGGHQCGDAKVGYKYSWM